MTRHVLQSVSLWVKMIIVGGGGVHLASEAQYRRKTLR